MYHAFLEVVGTDFNARCLLIKPNGICNILPISGPFISATKIGSWIKADGADYESPLAELDDQCDKIREYILQESESIFLLKEGKEEAQALLSRTLNVAWAVALTYVFPDKARRPATTGRIFSQFSDLENFLKFWSWKQEQGHSLFFDVSTTRRLADLLGLGQISPADISYRPRPIPIVQNPYHFNSEVGPERFRGRTPELRRAKICLLGTPTTPVALIGLQRTGKSSLAKEIVRQIREEDKGIRYIRYVLGNFSQNVGCEDITGYLMESFSPRERQYVSEYTESANRRKKGIGLERELFKRALSRLKKVTGTDTILFLDELQKLDERTAGKGFETFADYLEDIAKDESLGLKLIVSARPTIFSQNERIKRTNLLKLFEHIKVASVDIEAALQIINLGHHLLEFTDDAIRRILSLSGSNPYWIQLLCSKVFLEVEGKGKGKQISEDLVDNVFHGILTDASANAYFAAFHQDIQTMGPPALLLEEVANLASEEGARISCDALANACRSAREAISPHLELLANFEILVKHTNENPVTVSFKAEALRQWRRYATNLPLHARHP